MFPSYAKFVKEPPGIWKLSQDLCRYLEISGKFGCWKLTTSEYIEDQTWGHSSHSTKMRQWSENIRNVAPLDLELYYILLLSYPNQRHLRCISDVSCRLVGGICRLHLFDLLHQGLDLRGTSKFLDFQAAKLCQAMPSYAKLCQAARICIPPSTWPSGELTFCHGKWP